MDSRSLHRNNCVTFALQGILFAVGFIFFDTAGILPRFVKEISGSDVLAGVPHMLRLISTTLLQILSIGYIRRIRNVTRYITGFMTISYLAPVVMLATLLFDASGTLIIISVFVSMLIMWSTDGMMVISYYAVFSRTVKADSRSTVSGIMQAVGGIGGIGSSILVKILLDNEQLTLKMRYALIFLIGIAILMLAVIAISRTKDVPPESRVEENATLRGELKNLRNIAFQNKSFILIMITQVFFLLSAMTVPHLLNMFEAKLSVVPTKISTLLNFQSAGIMVGGLIPILCGKKFGNGFLVFFYCFSSAVCGLLSLISVCAGVDSFVLLAVISVAGGITTCSWVAFYNVIIDVSGENEVTVLMLGNSILSLILSVATVLGGMIITYVGYVWIFSVALVCAVVGVTFSMLTMVVMRQKQMKQNNEEKGHETV